MKLLFVTGLYPKDQERLLKDLSGGFIQNAPNAFQWAVIEGLDLCGVNYEVVSCPFLPAYPQSYKKHKTPFSDITFKGKKIGQMISYCNLAVYKTYSINLVLKKYVKDWVARNKKSGEQLVVLTYTPYHPFISALRGLKKEGKIIVASIITDLVDDMQNYESNRSFLKRLQCEYEKVKTKMLYSYIDKFILLADSMKEKIPLAIGKSIVVEGIASNQYIFKSKKRTKLKTILYAGTLQPFSCIDTLIKAFMKIEMSDIRLVICGSGPLKEMIEESVKQDERIDFRGLVSREESMRLQKEATFVINPRRPDGGITKFSFPSKTMEYLASGTPMIGYRLEGIPEEYYQYFYTVDSNDESSLVSTLIKVLQYPQEELDKKSKAAFNFIRDNKTSQCQVQRIIDFLKK